MCEGGEGGCASIYSTCCTTGRGDMLARSWGFVSKASTIFELALYDRVETHCKSVANIAFQRAKVRFNSIRKFLGKYRIDVFAVSLL